MKTKRILALLVALIMVFQLMPAAFAEETGEGERLNDQTTEVTPADDPVDPADDPEDPVDPANDPEDPVDPADDPEDPVDPADDPEDEPAGETIDGSVKPADDLNAVRYAAMVDGVYFSSLQDAINATGTEDVDEETGETFTYGSRIDLVRTISITGSVTVPAGKTVLLNLAGYSITASDTAIVDKGRLTIVDYANGSGKIIGR